MLLLNPTTLIVGKFVSFQQILLQRPARHKLYIYTKPQWSMTSIEDHHNGAQPQWKTTSIEADLNRRKPQ